jgi:hypothetical protein
MLRKLTIAFILVPAAIVWAQPSGSSSNSATPYQPSVPSSSSFNAYGGVYGGGGGTVEGSAMRGMASVISASGDYNLATSAAAVNATQAIKQDIVNRQDATQAYFAMRETNRQDVSAHRSKPLSQEQLVRIAASAAPKQLTSNDVDPVSGRIAWPDLLQDDAFAADRAAVEKLLIKRSQYGHLGISDQTDGGQAIERMTAKLQANAKSVSAQQYMAGKNFLKSLMYSLTKSQLS